MKARRDRSWTAAALLALLVLAACKRGSRPPDRMDPVTIDEARQFATAFGAALAPCDPTRVGALLDGDNLMRRAVHKSKLPAKLRRQMSGAGDGAPIAGLLCQGIGEDATYVLLRIKEVDGQPRPLFRLIADDAVNYHELELGTSRKDHVVRVVDIRVYASGDLLSESMTQMFDQVAVAMRAGGDPASIQRTTQALKEARVRGDSEEVRRLLSTMPPELRNAKPMRLAELMVGPDLDEAVYAEIMERYRHDFPDDPSIDVVAVDYYYLKKDMAGVLGAIEKLDKLVGGDPYLDVLRANAYLLDTEPAHLAEAERWARKATEAEPALENAWWSLAVALLRRGDHAAVLPVADTLRTRFEAQIDPESMAGNELWTAHFASAAYRDAHRPAPPPIE